MCPITGLVRKESDKVPEICIYEYVTWVYPNFFQVSCPLEFQLIKQLHKLGIHPPALTLTFKYQKVTWYFQTYLDVMLEHVGPVCHLWACVEEWFCLHCPNPRIQVFQISCRVLKQKEKKNNIILLFVYHRLCIFKLLEEMQKM